MSQVNEFCLFVRYRRTLVSSLDFSLIGMSPLDSPVSARLQATFSGSDHTLVATVSDFTPHEAVFSLFMATRLECLVPCALLSWNYVPFTQ